MCPKIYNLQFIISFIRKREKKHDSEEEKEKVQKKTTFENDSDDTIPEGVSKWNKIVFYDDTDWQFEICCLTFPLLSLD